MAHYVCGFMFNNLPYDHVVLIQKNRPAYQSGKLNGVGGGVERGESAVQAMIREFREETGVDTLPEDWHKFICMTSSHGDRIDFFYSSSSYDLRGVQSITDEKVCVVALQDLQNMTKMPNLLWEIEMAKSIMSSMESTKCFHVIEPESQNT